MAALKDIANAAGVSVGTVSRILNQGRAHLYSEETRRRVLEVSRQVGYRPNRFAQAMRLRKTRIVGFASVSVEPEGYLQSYTVYPFIVGLSQQLALEGYHVALVECSDLGDQTEPDRPWSIRDQFFDGLVVHYGLADRATRFAANVGVPLVWWDSGVFEPTGCIYRDESEVGRQVTRRLIELGHRRIGYIVGRRGWQDYNDHRPMHYSYAQRYESYRDEMRAHGLTEVPMVGYEATSLARQLTEQKITAVITQGGSLAPLDVVLGQLGWRVPEDLSVASLDREARILPRGVRVGGMLNDRHEVGRQAARMALAVLEHGKESAPSVRYVGEFDLGDTIGPPRTEMSHASISRIV